MPPEPTAGPAATPGPAAGPGPTGLHPAQPDRGDPGRLTLHVRLTKACNADCSYCSSWQASPGRAMRPDQFARALAFCLDHVLPVMGFAAGARSGHCTIQYVGGEILTVPADDLRAIVLHARERLATRFATVVDGVQSNLIASEARVSGLHTLFGGRIGTSVDHFTGARRVGGSPAAYRAILERSRARLKARRGFVPSSILVVDQDTVPHLAAEIALAEAAGSDLTLRPVFAGGRAIADAGADTLIAALGEAHRRWLMISPIRVEPFYHLTAARAARLGAGAVPPSHLACPFQKTCAQVSLDLEPNGDLYVCLDMADSGQLCLGNALEGRFDLPVWERLAARQHHYDTACRQCRYLAECQGGCMSEALHHTGSPYGRTDLCGLWLRILDQADAAIAVHGLQAVAGWLASLAPEARGTSPAPQARSPAPAPLAAPETPPPQAA